MEFIPLISGNGKKRGSEGTPLDQTPRKRRRSRKSYTGDPRLVSRLKQFIEARKYHQLTAVDDLLSDLQTTYPEYRRKKQNALKTCIMKVLNMVQRGQPNLLLPPTAQTAEKTHYEDSDFSDNAYVKYEDTNMVNKSLADLYSKAPPVVTLSPKPDEESGENSQNSDVPLNEAKETTGQNSALSLLRGKQKKKKPSKPEILLQESTVTFADLGGMETALKEVCKLLLHMKHPEVFEKLGVKPPRGVLLHGPPGCGKTLLAHAIAGELQLPFIKMAATEIVSGVSGESEGKVRELFERAVNSAPCVLFIDEIDAITPKRETAQREMERRIVSQLLICMDDLNQKEINMQVLVIGATNRPDSVDAAFRRAGRFDREICLGIPDEAARQRILRVLCRDLRISPDFDFSKLASKTPGYVGADLMALMREAAMSAINRIFGALHKSDQELGSQDNGTEFLPDSTLNNSKEADLKNSLLWLQNQMPLSDAQLEELFIEMDDFEEALKVVQPSAKREGFATVPSVTWDDIGALKDVRAELEIAILAPVRHKKQFEALGLQTSAGILLCGPPGCGKTLLAKAIANECGINFISVKGPELLNMYVGESERAVRQCFHRAKSSAPCVIFFDELDALCPRRSETADSGASSRVVNQLLTEMDGLESRKQVFILAATNRPDIIDPAVLRPGRLDKVVYVGLPTPDDRLDILKTITKNGTKPRLAEDVDLSAISHDCRCQGFTGADLAALVREAAVMALQEHLRTPDAGNTSTPHVFNKHFERAFGKMKPSISQKDQQLYEKMKKSLSSNVCLKSTNSIPQETLE